MTPSSASAAAYWIDASKSASNGCGLSAASACPDWATLMGDKNCPSCGCGSGGCRSRITSSTSGDTINFVAGGTWHGDGDGGCIAINFNRSPSSELIIQCTNGSGSYLPGRCTVDGSGISPGRFGGLVGMGMQNCTNSATARYVQWKGINIVASGISGSGNLLHVKGASSTNHIAVADATLDGAGGLSDDPVTTDNGSTFMTFKNLTITNCPFSGTYGCIGTQQSQNLAKVGLRLGPRTGFPNNCTSSGGCVNHDCATQENDQRVLLDGNTCHGESDGLDSGMLSEITSPIGNVITRYNVVYDLFGNQYQADHALKFSGDNPTGRTTGPGVWYKNVTFYATPNRFAGTIFVTERAQNADFWYNTLFSTNSFAPGDPTQRNAYVEATGNSAGNFPFLYNILDGTDVSGATSNTEAGNTACSASACRWSGNAMWFQERGASGACMRFKSSDLGDDSFNCDLSQRGGGPDFNSIAANNRNVHLNPNFANRSAATNGTTDPSVFALTPASIGYIDTGDSFCHANGAGSGNTIRVSCGPGTSASAFQDAKHYFPDPNDYYALANGDCAGKGVRSVEANGGGLGCYDIQIQGCTGNGGLGNLPGVRTANAVSATQITFDGAPCSWSSGAMVHVPWSGASPDLGAIEYFQGIPPPELLSVEPVS